MSYYKIPPHEIVELEELGGIMCQAAKDFGDSLDMYYYCSVGKALSLWCLGKTSMVNGKLYKTSLSKRIMVYELVDDSWRLVS